MFNTLPPDSDQFQHWTWDQVKPYFDDLETRPLNADMLECFMQDWSHLHDLLAETRWWLYVQTTRDTTSEAAARAYATWLQEVFPRSQAANQVIRDRLLDSGLTPDNFAIPLQKLEAETVLYSEENLPLLAEERRLASEYERVRGAQTVIWDGEETTIYQMNTVYYNPDRDRRERGWRLAAARQLEDRARLNDLWVRIFDLRTRIADNAEYSNYRDYRWQMYKRFDYTPEDCATFRAAIEEVVVPAARRIYERKRRQLGVETLRPWDTFVDPLNRPPLQPYETIDELVETVSTIFYQVDPELGECFDWMREEGRMDLENRKGKAPGAYSMPLDAQREPFIFMNAVGLHEDVMTLLHEAGHSFHVYEAAHWPYHQQRAEPFVWLEVAEVASMAMELLAAPYLHQDEGGFYDDEDYARARIEHLEQALLFWPYMAVVDAWQHWAYTSGDAARDPAACDAKMSELWDRFMVGIDYSGLEDAKATRWQRQLHIYTDPFYYIDYGLAQLGAVQVWRNALEDQAAAVKAYRHALSLGNTVSIPGFYRAAGVRFAFDAATLREAVDLMERTIEEYQTEP